MQHKLTILSQGPHHFAIFKPHNISVVGGHGVVRPTLLDLMREKFGKNVFAVHRLDRVTAGITIFARSLFAKHALENAFKKRLVKKTYLAICEGKPGFNKLTIDDRLKRMGDNQKGGPAQQTVHQSGENAITNVQLIKQLNENFCLIKAIPVSGRLHQIRAHLAHVGLPIVGDKLYGAKTSCAPHTIALCAAGISLPLPKGGRLEIDATHLFKIQDYVDVDDA